MNDDPTPLTAAAVAAEHPEWVTAWRNEGATAEQERTAAIDALPLVGHEDLVRAARADRTCTAAVLSQRVIEAEAAQRNAKVAALKAAENKLDGPKPAPSEQGAGAATPSASEAGRGIAERFRSRFTSTRSRS